MFLSSLIEELCTKEENNKAGCTLTFGGQCTLIYLYILNLWKTISYAWLCIIQTFYPLGSIFTLVIAALHCGRGNFS